MARTLRLPYPGAIYHWMSRGDHREAVFREDAERGMFPAGLAGACAKTEGQVQACCRSCPATGSLQSKEL